MSIISAGTSNTTSLVYTGDTTGNLAFQTNGTTEAMRIDTNGNVGIGETSPAGSANYKQLVIRGTSGAELSLKGGSTQYGYVYVDNGGFRIINPQSGSASGTLQFHTSNTERMRIDSSGRVTMPYQPTFTASLTNGNTGTSGTIVYNSSDINVGGHYNTTNGRFTVPIAGVYMFSITGISVNTTTVEAAIMVNGSGTYINARGGSNTSSTAAGYCGVIFISLAVNDYVSVRIEGGVAQYGFGNYTTFSGRLMN